MARSDRPQTFSASLATFSALGEWDVDTVLPTDDAVDERTGQIPETEE